MQPTQPQPIELNPIQLSHAYAVCRGVARRAAKNFYFAFLVLPQAKRNAICAVYAYMRHADDITDDRAMASEDRRQKLAEWLQAARDVFSGQWTDDPVLYALSDAQQRYKLPIELFEQLVTGTAMDLEPERYSRFERFDDLYQYCYYVASVVGLVCIRIFGFAEDKTGKATALAERVGVGFQLTNIIRDVKEDASLGRVYLPQEDLVKFKLQIPSESAYDPAVFQPLLEFEAERARTFYRAAGELLPLLDADSRPAFWALVTIYRRLLDRIAERNYDVFLQRVSLSTFEKLTILARAWWARIFFRPLSL